MAGRRPDFVERTPGDLYKSILFPNYHYVKLTIEKDRLHGAMYRIANPEAKNLTVELKDSFDLIAKPKAYGRSHRDNVASGTPQ